MPAPDPEHAAHDHGEEGFPRGETAELVARELRAGATRERWQPWLVALGVALVALALPTELLFGDARELVTRTDQGQILGAHVVPCALAGWLTRCGMHAERAWFLLSAVFYAASVLPLVALADERGWERAPGILVALVVLGTTTPWMAGTLPGSGAAQLFGACLLASSLARRTPRAGASIAAWIAAALLSAQNVALFPAVIVSLAGAPRRAAALAGAFAALAVVLAGLALLPDEAGVWSAITGTVPLFQRAKSAAMFLSMSVLLAPALMFALLPRRGSSYEAWPLVFGAGALLAVCVPIGPGVSATWLALVPIAAIGGLAVLQRADETGKGALVRLIVAALALSGAVVTRGMQHKDPGRAWLDTTAETLDPGDVVLSLSGEHLYLLRHRFHVETIDARPTVSLSEADRTAFWAAQGARVAELRAAKHHLVLDEAPLDWNDPLHTTRSRSEILGARVEIELYRKVKLLPFLPAPVEDEPRARKRK